MLDRKFTQPRIVDTIIARAMEQFMASPRVGFDEQVALNFLEGAQLMNNERIQNGMIHKDDADYWSAALAAAIVKLRNLRVDTFVAARTTEKLDAELAWQVYQKTKGHCTYCGVFLNPFKRSGGIGFHIDHAVSKLQGGSNDIGNLVPSCAKCNIGKGSESRPAKGDEDVS